MVYITVCNNKPNQNFTEVQLRYTQTFLGLSTLPFFLLEVLLQVSCKFAITAAALNAAPYHRLSMCHTIVMECGCAELHGYVTDRMRSCSHSDDHVPDATQHNTHYK